MTDNLMSPTVNATTVRGQSGIPGIYEGNPEPMSAPMVQFRRNTAQYFGTDYAYLCHTQGGMVHGWGDGLGSFAPGSYDPPPTYIHEDTRQFVALFAADKAAAAVVVFDRINVTDPTALAKFDRYRAEEQLLMVGAPTWQWHLHMTPEPTVAGNTASWTAGTNLCKSDWLYPASASLTKEDETILSPYAVFDTLKKWRIRYNPTVTTQWNPLLSVISARNTGKTVTPTLITGTVDSIGVHLAWTGNDNRVVILNSIQRANLPAFPSPAQCEAVLLTAALRTTSFTIGWNQTTASAKVILCGLSTTKTWAYALDGGASTGITVNSNGIGELTVSSAVAHSIAVTAS
jgi:hypothetical protein